MASGNSVGGQVRESKDAPRRIAERHACAEYDRFQTYYGDFMRARVEMLRRPSFRSKVNPGPDTAAQLLRLTSTNGKKCHVEYNAKIAVPVRQNLDCT